MAITNAAESASNSSSNSSSSSCGAQPNNRRSVRKRLVPDRFGFHENEDDAGHNNNDADAAVDVVDEKLNGSAGRKRLKITRKRRGVVLGNTKTSNARSSQQKKSLLPCWLLDLPEELLDNILCNYLSTATDRRALSQTCNKFYRLSKSDKMTQNLQFLLHANDPRLSNESTTALGITTGVATASQSFPIRPAASDATGANRDRASVHQASTRRMVQTLLPFAQHDNKDALFILGLIAVYVEDDLEVGLSLLQKGAALQSARCLYELGLLLMRHDKTIGQDYLDQAALLGHAQAQLIHVSRHGISKELKHQAQRELWADYRIGLHHLLSNKPHPTRTRWGPFHCDNPYCVRIHYRSTRRCREWLSTKPRSPEWLRLRPDVLQCGMDPNDTHFDATEFYFVHRMPTCGGCRTATYCGAACQRLHWKRHKQMCRVIMANNNMDDNDDNNDDNNDNDENNNNNENN